MQDHHQPGLGGEVENPIERRIRQAGCLARHFRRHELLVDAELADAREHAGERQQDTADVIDSVHVGRVEAGDHRVEAGLLGRRQRAVRHRDGCVGERIVVERRVAVQVVGGREVAGVAIRPLLLQRDAEERGPARPRPHDSQELARREALLDIVGQMEVRVVELVGGARPLRAKLTREDDGQQRQAGD